MNENDDMTEQRLHCLVDGETDAQERAEVLAAIEQDSELKELSCDLARQKELVRLAYADIEPPVHGVGGRRTLWSVAAGLVLAIGAAGLFMGSQNMGSMQSPVVAPPMAATSAEADRVVLLDADGSGKTLANPQREETRIVFQMTHPEMSKAAEVLDEIEQVLEQYAADERPLRVELVAHGYGLKMLRKGLSDQGERIARLSQRFHNLTFVACRNTAERIENDQGFGVEFLPQVVVIQSGVAHVAKLQSEGWLYIHI